MVGNMLASIQITRPAKHPISCDKNPTVFLVIYSSFTAILLPDTSELTSFFIAFYCRMPSVKQPDDALDDRTNRL